MQAPLDRRTITEPQIEIRRPSDEGLLPISWKDRGRSIDAAEFSGYFQHFQNSAFRLEALAQYAVSHEDSHFGAYVAGEAVPPFKYTAWKETIRNATSAGKAFDVVRVVPPTVTSYFSYEVEWCYPEYAEDGQVTRMVASSQLQESLGTRELPDFWLFDDKFAVVIDYTADGDVVGFFRIDEPGAIDELRSIRDLVQSRAIPFENYLKDFRPSRGA